MTFKTDLTDLLHTLRDQQIAFPDYLTEEERAAAGAPDAWSAKDEVMHINTWANRHFDNLEVLLSGGVPAEQDFGDFEDENRAIFEKHKNDTWEEAQAMTRSTYDQIDAFIAGSDEAMLRSVPPGQERPVWRIIAGNYISHPMIHLMDYLQRHGYHDLLTALFGAQFAQRMLNLDDDDGWRGTTYYNLACINALMGQQEEAINALARSLQLVPELLEWSKQDSDLDSLRDDPAYQALYSESENSNQSEY